MSYLTAKTKLIKTLSLTGTGNIRVPVEFREKLVQLVPSLIRFTGPNVVIDISLKLCCPFFQLHLMTITDQYVI